MKLRPYQLDVLMKIDQELKKGDEVVVASAPNSGKTLIATEFMRNNREATFVVLTHGTLVLKAQWKEALDQAGLEFSEKIGERRITYGIPQSLYRKLGHKVDYLIIDEAHEFTFAEMVKEIKAKVNPKKTIYLTGTPSKFIARNYKVIVVPAIQLIEENHSSDLYVGMVSTNAPIHHDDHNKDGDIVASSTKKLEGSVTADLDELLSAMHSRLCETGAFKGSPTLRKTVEWAPTLGKLYKTMIACRSIKQADQVCGYFIGKGILALCSHSENDPDSANIERFRKESDIKILVVVDRGILGFNMEDLVNVVDLTCSRNIDRTYQLYARAMRKSATHSRKYFFKLSTEDHMLLSKFYMNASLMLMFEDFISRYNGKNLNGCKVPVQVSKEPREEKPVKVGGKTPKAPVIAVDAFFKGTVEAGALLIDIHNKIGSSTNEYAYVTLGNIRDLSLDGKVLIPDQRKQWVKDFCIKNGYIPNQKSKDLEESKLGSIASYWMTENNIGRDTEFSEFIQQIPSWESFKGKKIKEKYLQFCSDFGYRPRGTKLHPFELNLKCSVNNYFKGRACEDLEFDARAKGFPTYEQKKSKEKIRLVQSWIDINKRIPLIRDKMPDLTSLGVLYSNLNRAYPGSFDVSGISTPKALTSQRVLANLSAILDFCKLRGYRPRRGETGSASEEHRLGSLLSDYKKKLSTADTAAMLLLNQILSYSEYRKQLK